MRRCGVLLPLFSLPGPDCIGTMGSEARAFVDFLAGAGQSVWQVLPLTLPARGNSPYSAVSAFAGNPCYISLEPLVDKGYLQTRDCLPLGDSPEGRVDYDACRKKKLPLLRRAFTAARGPENRQIEEFRRGHKYWIEDFASFMAGKCVSPVAGKTEGPPEAEERAFWVYTQYLFFDQCRLLCRYARQRGVRLMGDIPLYADVESADVWAHPELFQLEPDTGRPLAVAGVPPDAFSREGQIWGNPLYDWKALKKTGYHWWMERLRVCALLYDSVRIDHFRGLAEYYAIPAGASTARGGHWEEGPGEDFIRRLKALPCDFVAEDLGHLTPGVTRLLRQSGFPGMRVLLFAFHPGEESSYLPHNMVRDCVAYIGTHDNDTARGWMETAPACETRFARRYLRLTRREGYHWGFIRALYASVADSAIVQMQDFLGLGNEARTNIPAVPEGNWEWRMSPGYSEDGLAKKIKAMARLYGRLPK